MPRIRPASSADQPAIRALVRRAGINPFGLKWQRFLVAVDERGALIGCGQVKPHRDGSRELASIAVERPWRGQGVAATIIRSLLDQYPGPLYLTCRASLEGFYRRFGFNVIPSTEMPSYFRIIHFLSRMLGKFGLLPEKILVMKRGT